MKSKSSVILVIFLIVLVAILGQENTVWAKISEEIPGKVMDKFISQTQGWWGQLRNYALSIFALTLTIEICLFGIRMTLQRSDLGEILGQFIHLMLFACFIWVVILHYEEWAQAVAIRGLEGVAQNLTNSQFTVDRPMKLASNLWQNVDYVIQNVEISHYPELFCLIFIVVIIMLAFFILSALMILVKCEFYIVANIGILIIGLGGSKIFKDYAISVMRYVLGLALKIFVIQLVANIGLSVIGNDGSVLNEKLPNFENLVVMLAQAIILVILAKTLPDACMGLLSGSVTSGGNPLAAAAMGAGGAAAAWAGKKALGGIQSGASSLAGTPGALKNAHTVAKGAGAKGLGGTLAGMGRAISDARKDAKAAGDQKKMDSDPGSLFNHLRSAANAAKTNSPSSTSQPSSTPASSPVSSPASTGGSGAADAAPPPPAPGGDKT